MVIAPHPLNVDLFEVYGVLDFEKGIEAHTVDSLHSTGCDFSPPAPTVRGTILPTRHRRSYMTEDPTLIFDMEL